MSSTATVTPSAPGRPAAIRFSQAPTASMPPGEVGSRGVAWPCQGRKFHCFVTQPPGIAGEPPIEPGSLGTAGSSVAEAVAM